MFEIAGVDCNYKAKEKAKPKMTQDKLKFFSARGLQYLGAVWLGKKNWKYVKDDLQYIIAELRKYEVMLEKKNVTTNEIHSRKSAARSPIADSDVYTRGKCNTGGNRWFDEWCRNLQTSAC